MQGAWPATYTDAMTSHLPWPNRFAALGPAFYTELQPQGLPQPHWVATSPACAALLGLAPDWADDEALQVFSGNALWPGMRPLASVYSGHQFGVWAGQLGDGRAHWLGELHGTAGGFELQLKGAGRTPYSRMGDGRAVLRSSIREFLCSEAMAALGIPTTRALCITASALPVRREMMETAAIVTRLAPSFVRFGHFEHFSHNGRHAELRALADFLIRHHAPECADAAVPSLALAEKVARQTAELIAAWQAVGFCHGVMNTDNMSMLGLTLDYGPFGFMDSFNPGHICNHSDERGRYAYANQPNVGFWNLHALAQALLPLVPGEPEAASEKMLAAIGIYREVYAPAEAARWRAKLGLTTERAEDAELINDWLGLLAGERVDFTLAHRRLGTPAARDLFIDRAAYDAWSARHQTRLGFEPAGALERMRAVNPAVVLRNHLAENAIRAAQQGDFSEVERLLRVLSTPFAEPENPQDAALPPDWAQELEVSCSS
ncbi:MAG: YdiU family protein [Paucibacter sp.]|nr:YdiU family protein [Roseateles sp.]